MQQIEITPRHRELTSGDVLLALRTALPVVGFEVSIECAHTRRMDIFEEHVLKLVQAGEGRIRLQEASDLLGCSRLEFMEDAVATLESGRVVELQAAGGDRVVHRGDRFEESMRSLTIDESDLVVTRQFWYQHTSGHLTGKNPGRRSETPRPIPDHVQLAVHGKVKNDLVRWFEGDPDLLSEGRFMSIREIDGLHHCDWDVEILAVYDRHEGDWYLELFDAGSGDRLPDIQDAMEESLVPKVRELLADEMETTSVLCREVGPEEAAMTVGVKGPTIVSADDVPEDLDSERFAKALGMTYRELVDWCMENRIIRLDPGQKRLQSHQARRIRRRFKAVKEEQASEQLAGAGSPATGSFETLETVEARQKLFEMISDAKHEVIISLPFVNEDGIMDFLPAAREAIRDRGVQFVFLWGIARSEQQEMRGDARKLKSAKKALKSLRDLRDKATGVEFIVRWRGNDHTKWIMCDRSSMLHGSYNMLSYRPRPDEPAMGIRREEMMWFPVIDAGEAARRINRVPGLAVDAVRGEASDGNGIDDDSDRIDAWCRILRVQSSPESIGMLQGAFDRLTPVQMGRLFTAACRGAEMSCCSSPDTARGLAHAIDSLAEAYPGRKDSKLIAKADRPGWRSYAESLHRRLQAIEPAAGLGSTTLEGGG